MVRRTQLPDQDKIPAVETDCDSERSRRPKQYRRVGVAKQISNSEAAIRQAQWIFCVVFAIPLGNSLRYIVIRNPHQPSGTSGILLPQTSHLPAFNKGNRGVSVAH